MEKVTIRQAEPKDFLALEKMEQKIWHRGNRMKPFDCGHFTTWLNTYPVAFQIGIKNEKILGFVYFQKIDLDAAMKDGNFKNFDMITDHGYSAKTHAPNGNYHFGITLCSQSPGVGEELSKYALDYPKKTKTPLIIPSRVPTLDKYLSGQKPQPDLPIKELVLRYAQHCERMTKASSASPGQKLPVKVDPILNFYFKTNQLSILAVVPDFVEDPRSRNFTILLVQNF